MIDLIYTGAYTHSQKMRQTTACCFLGLNVSGLNYCYVYSPQKTLAFTSCNYSLTLIPPGFTLDFSYGRHRENYVSLCHIPNLTWNPARNVMELHIRNAAIALPFLVHLTPTQLELLKSRFLQLVTLSHSPLTKDLAVADLLMDGILGEFLKGSQRTTQPPIPSLLLHFKQAIDADTHFQCNLTELMTGMDVTPTHLRRLFFQFYHMTPSEYQARRRFNAIQQLMTNTNCSFKEIAAQVGMGHVTHLHAFIKKRCGLTPQQLQRNLMAQ